MAAAYPCNRCGETHWHYSDEPLAIRIANLRARDGDLCALCGLLMDFERLHNKKIRPSVDHILEQRNGGCTRHDNLRLTHLFCNTVRAVVDDPKTHWDFPWQAIRKLYQLRYRKKAA